METIIGLLFILLPVIFKLIGKNLDKAAEVGTDGTLEEVIEFSSEIDEAPSTTQHPSVSEQVRTIPDDEPRLKPIVQKAPVVVDLSPVVRKPVNPGKDKSQSIPIRMEEEKKAKADLIDPKKLVVYSEIMKPKFLEH